MKITIVKTVILGLGLLSSVISCNCSKDTTPVPQQDDTRPVKRATMEIQFGAGNNRPRFIDITHQAALTIAQGTANKSNVDIVGFVSFGGGFYTASPDCLWFGYTNLGSNYITNWGDQAKGTNLLRMDAAQIKKIKAITTNQEFLNLVAGLNDPDASEIAKRDEETETWIYVKTYEHKSAFLHVKKYYGNAQAPGNNNDYAEIELISLTE